MIEQLLKDILKRLYKNQTKEDIAASVQYFTEKKILEYAHRARKYGSKLVYSWWLCTECCSQFYD
jgi:hypothetical protein